MNILFVTKKLLIFIFGLIIIFSLYYLNTITLEFAHFFIELTGTIIAVTIFSIGWNTREYSKSNFRIILALGYLLVGILTTFHIATSSGINIITNVNVNYPIHFWLFTRFFEGLTILVAAFFLNHKKKIDMSFGLMNVLFFAIMVIFLVFANVLPNCYIEGIGLTNFKKIIEYVICGVFLLSGYILWKNRLKIEKKLTL